MFSGPNNFTLLTAKPRLPNCSYGTEIAFLLNPDNDAEYGSFFTDPHDGGIVVDIQRAREYREFCIDRGFQTMGDNFRWMGTVAVVCQDNLEIACRIKPCIRSCCKPPTVYDLELNICREPYGFDDRIVFNPKIRSGDETIDPFDAGALFLDGFPKCKLGSHLYNLTVDQDGELVILETGELQLKSGLFDHQSYCIKYVESREENGKLDYFNQAVVCAQEDVRSTGYLWWQDKIDYKVCNLKKN